MDVLSIFKMDSLINCHRCGYMPCFQPTQLMRFFMTSCGKVFCENCTRSKQNEHCESCRAVCKFMEITGESTPEVKMFFMDPSHVLRDVLKKPMQILQFQKNQQKNVTKVMSKLLEANKAAREEINALRNEILQHKQNTESLTQLNQQLTQRINNYESQTRFNNTPNFPIPTPLGPLSGNNAQGEHRNSTLNLFGETTQGQTVNHIHNTSSFQPSLISPFPVTNQNTPQINFNQSINRSGGSFDGRRRTPGSGYIPDTYRQIERVSPSPTISLASGSFTHSQSQFMMSGISRSVPPEKIARTLPRLSQTPGTVTDTTQTPEIIHRLRHLRCNVTPASSRF